MYTYQQDDQSHQPDIQFQSKSNSKDFKQKWTILEVLLTMTSGI